MCGAWKNAPPHWGKKTCVWEVKESWLGTAPNVYARGRLKMKQGMDGIQTHYFYEETDRYGALYKVTAETRIAGESVPGLSSRKVTYVSGQGNNMRYEQYARLADGAWSMTDASSYEYDVENRWVKQHPRQWARLRAHDDLLRPVVGEG